MVYIKTSKLSITHEDQEKDNLKFQVIVSKDNIDYVQVEGPEESIKNWKARVEGIDSTIEEINSIIALLPKSEDQILKGRLTSLEMGLANILGA